VCAAFHVLVVALAEIGVQDRMTTLCAHGIAHLLGYDLGLGTCMGVGSGGLLAHVDCVSPDTTTKRTKTFNSCSMWKSTFVRATRRSWKKWMTTPRQQWKSQHSPRKYSETGSSGAEGAASGSAARWTEQHRGQQRGGRLKNAMLLSKYDLRCGLTSHRRRQHARLLQTILCFSCRGACATAAHGGIK